MWSMWSQLLLLAHAHGILSTVYIDAGSGSDTVACGVSVTKACRTLNHSLWRAGPARGSDSTATTLLLRGGPGAVPFPCEDGGDALPAWFFGQSAQVTGLQLVDRAAVIGAFPAGARAQLDCGHRGRALLAVNTRLSVRDVTVLHGQADMGGAALVLSGTVRLERAVFVSNVADSRAQLTTAHKGGGALYAWQCDKVNISHSTFASNAARNYQWGTGGGAILLPQLLHVPAPIGSGGAVSIFMTAAKSVVVEAATVEVSGNHFAGCRASRSGAVSFVPYENVALSRANISFVANVFTGNTANNTMTSAQRDWIENVARRFEQPQVMAASGAAVSIPVHEEMRDTRISFNDNSFEQNAAISDASALDHVVCKMSNGQGRGGGLALQNGNFTIIDTILRGNKKEEEEEKRGEEEEKKRETQGGQGGGNGGESGGEGGGGSTPVRESAGHRAGHSPLEKGAGDVEPTSRGQTGGDSGDDGGSGADDGSEGGGDGGEEGEPNSSAAALMPDACPRNKCERDGNEPCLSCPNDQQCEEGYTGPICKLCDPEGYARKGNNCIECPPFNARNVAGVALLVLFVVILIVVLYRNRHKPWMQPTVLSIVVTFLEMISVMEETFEVEMPESYESIVARVRGAFANVAQLSAL
eukprot:g2230.t1